MSLRKSRKTNKKSSYWQVLINDADERIAQAEARLEQLKLARASFKQKADSGEPYPIEETQSQSHNSAQQHSV